MFFLPNETFKTLLFPKSIDFTILFSSTTVLLSNLIAPPLTAL